MRLTPDQRHSLVNGVRKGKHKKVVASIFGVSVKTVRKWCKRAHHRGRESFKDKPRKSRKRKITLEVELSIIALRNTFNWGTARIKQNLYCAPDYVLDVVPNLVQEVTLSRTAINNVLKKHGINGYKREQKAWKFFRAKRPDELWQLDIKGPYTVQGKKYYSVVCIDDYSRYLIFVGTLDHEPTVEEIENMLEPCVRKRKPESILTDNKPFKKGWDKWCERNEIKPLHAHPYYPQDKGKVERMIRNVSEEFINVVKKFPKLLGTHEEYQEWYNTKRYHHGIKTIPCEIYL